MSRYVRKTAIGFGNDAVLCLVFQQWLKLGVVVWVEVYLAEGTLIVLNAMEHQVRTTHLIDCRCNPGVLEKNLELLDTKIADPNAPSEWTRIDISRAQYKGQVGRNELCKALFSDFLQLAPRTNVVFHNLRCMDEVQVKVLDADLKGSR